MLSVALETPEHSGRLRGVGSYVSPAMYYGLPKGKEKRTRVTKADLEKTKNDFEKTKRDLLSQIAELKAEMKEMASTSKLHSPILSDKASCRVEGKDEFDDMKQNKSLKVVKELIVEKGNKNDDCVPIDGFDPSSPEKKVKISVYY